MRAAADLISFFSSFCFFYCSGHHLDLHSFPTRRSSDLRGNFGVRVPAAHGRGAGRESSHRAGISWALVLRDGWIPDRKSTRLNSSHRTISYAVFCLKKKNKEQTIYHIGITFNKTLLMDF